jgi:hypothetical protein
MKAISSGSLIVCFFLFSVSTNAQKYTTKVFSGGFGIEGGLPSGSAETGMKGSFGVDVHFGFRAGPGFVTLTGGVNGFLGAGNDQGRYYSDDYSGGIFPVRVGYKHFFQRHVFIMADAGLQKYFVSRGNGDGRNENVNGIGFTYCPSVGAQFGVFEISFKYEVFEVNGGNISNAAIRLGLDF